MMARSFAVRQDVLSIATYSSRKKFRLFGNRALALLATGLIILSRCVTHEDGLGRLRSGTFLETAVRRCIVSAISRS
jgi:hypothetical protein